MGKQWMVVYTKPKNEKKVADLLTRQYIENYCPVRRVLKQWSDRKKYVDEVIIRSYVFVHVEESERIHVLQTPGVLNFVYWLKKPVVVRDAEMHQLMSFLSEFQHSAIEVKEIPIGAKAKITQGPLVSQEGEVVKINKNTVVLRLYSAGLEISATVEQSAIEITDLNQKKTTNNKLINRIK